MSGQNLRVRPGRPEDAPSLRAIRLEALLDSPDAYGETYAECVAWSDDDWAQRARQWNFYVAEIDGRVVGMARGSAHDERPDTRWLFAMYVSPAARGSDAARRLVEAVCAWAVSQGVGALHLYVSRAVPRARSFYTKFGFVDTGPTLSMHRDDNLVCEEMRRELADFDFHVRRVAPETLYDLRRRILRADDPFIDVTNPGDHLQSTVHFGGLLGERTVVSASLYAAPSPFALQTPTLQLRYMATDFDVQGRGLAKRLLSQLIDDLSRRGVSSLWANARTSALDFYVGNGWSIRENSFFVSPESGVDHVVISRSLN